jgi:hypothetical protein
MRLFKRLALAACQPVAAALGQKQIISFDSDGDDTLQLAGGDISGGQIRVSENEYWGVIRAAGDLAIDFGRVTKNNLTLSNGKSDADPAQFKYKPVDTSNNTIVSCQHVV